MRHRGNSRILRQVFAELAIPPSYGTDPYLPRYADAATLVEVGPDIYGRPQRLDPTTAAHWHEMREAAATDGIELRIVSGFRDRAYQIDLFRKKLAQGQAIETILTVNAAPGFSQHHTGKALDLTTTGCDTLAESFADTAAFAWLQANAARFGFKLPYGRDNPFGFCFEPWHWSRLPLRNHSAGGDP